MPSSKTAPAASGTEATASSSVARAEALLDRLGQGVGDMRRTVAQKTASSAQKAVSSNDTPAAVATVPANERAEALLTQAGEKLGRWSSEAYRQLRRTAALAREEAEDIWAEAQTLRGSGVSAETHPALEAQEPPTPADEGGAD